MASMMPQNLSETYWHFQLDCIRCLITLARETGAWKARGETLATGFQAPEVAIHLVWCGSRHQLPFRVSSPVLGGSYFTLTPIFPSGSCVRMRDSASDSPCSPMTWKKPQKNCYFRNTTTHFWLAISYMCIIIQNNERISQWTTSNKTVG